jgi:hypothetical protein
MGVSWQCLRPWRRLSVVVVSMLVSSIVVLRYVGRNWERPGGRKKERKEERTVLTSVPNEKTSDAWFRRALHHASGDLCGSLESGPGPVTHDSGPRATEFTEMPILPF